MAARYPAGCQSEDSDAYRAVRPDGTYQLGHQSLGVQTRDRLFAALESLGAGGVRRLWFFTTNPEFFSHNQYFPGVQSQTQRPVASLEVHVSYDVRPRLWISLDANFWAGGETSLNAVANRRPMREPLDSGPLPPSPSLRITTSRSVTTRAPITATGATTGPFLASWQYAWL